MRLILSGGGCGKQVSKSYEKYAEIIDENKPVLYIPLAWRNKDYDGCLEWLKGELLPYGIDKFMMITDVNQFNNINLDDYNSLFIGGGNTYKLLKYLKESEGYSKIEEYIKNGGIVFGGSAGAIIFGKDIQTCNICSSDENLWPDLDTSGFDVMNGKSLSCHYGSEGRKKEHDNNTEKYKKRGFDIISLTEEQSAFVTDEKVEIIDNSKENIKTK